MKGDGSRLKMLLIVGLIKKVSTNILMEQADLALKNNYFEHSSQTCKQEQGTAIGAKFPSSYGILYMSEIEEKGMSTFHFKPRFGGGTLMIFLLSGNMGRRSF